MQSAGYREERDRRSSPPAHRRQPGPRLGGLAAVACRDCGWAQAVNEDYEDYADVDVVVLDAALAGEPADATGFQVFQGTVHGTLATEPLGSSGFGYDPIFIPDSDHRTYAQMTSEEKNKISRIRT
jgi:hypothetical protein